MILKNFQIVFRNFWQNRGLYSINIVGLAIGMMAVLLIYQYIRFEKEYDKFLDKPDRIHRLVLYRYYQTGLDKSVGNNYFVGQIAHEKIPEIENFCRCKKETVYIQTGEQIFKEERVFFADSSFFDIFSYPVIAGDKKKFLRSPGVAVITESTAKRYFGDNDPVGKTIYGGNSGKNAMLVQGVVKDIPENSHLKFEIVISLSSLTNKSYCYGCNNTNTYFLLKEGSDPVAISEKITTLALDYLKSMNAKIDFPIEYHLQPVTDIHLNSDYRFEHEVNGNKKYVAILTVIAIFIFLSASLNYANLYTSFARKRIIGTGTKIINGAGRKDIILEFTIEAFLTGLLSLILAYLLLFLIFPFIRTYLNLNFSISSLIHLSKWLLPSIILMVVSLIIGIIIGLKVFTFTPVSVLKKVSIKISSGNFHRFIFITQFTIAIFLLTSTMGVIKQISYMQKDAITMNIDQTLVIKLPRNSASSQLAFRDNLKKIPEIAEITHSSVTPGENNTWVKGGITLKGKEKFDDQMFQSSVAPGFFSFFNVKLLAGRDFLSNEDNWNGSAKHIIINKEAALAFGESNFKQLIGKMVYDTDNKKDLGEIVGVVDGYFQNSLDQEINPTIFNPDQAGNFMFLKVKKTDAGKLISKIKSEFGSSFNDQFFEFFFLDDYFNAQYKSHNQLYRCFVLFSIMAVIITCLSLLGLVTSMSIARTKEIGIRKVNGARVSEILVLLNADLVICVISSFIIASPIAWYAMNKWLGNFAYRTELSWWIFAVAGLLALTLAMLTTTMQSFKTARKNPVEALKYE